MFKPSHIFAFGLGAGLTVLLMLFIGYQLDGDMGFCRLEAAASAAETPVTCAREWIGALSGWVAAAGAISVGLPTLKWLKAQTQLNQTEQRIETATKALNTMRNREHCLYDLFPIPDKTETQFEYLQNFRKNLEECILAMEDAQAILDDISPTEVAGTWEKIKKLKRVLRYVTDFLKRHQSQAELTEKDVIQNPITIIRDMIDIEDAYVTQLETLEKRTIELKEWFKKHTVPA